MFTGARSGKGGSFGTLLITFLLGFGIGYSVHYVYQRPASEEVSSLPTAPPVVSDTKETVVSAPPEPAPPATPPVVETKKPAARYLFIAVEGEQLSDGQAAFLKTVQPGGVVLQENNLVNREQTAAFVTSIKRAVSNRDALSDWPLIAIDQEGGKYNRLGLKEAPSAADLGLTRDTEAARQIGRSYAEACMQRGIGVMLAPVLDVFESGSEYEHMQVRSFGSKQGLVTALGLAFADGVQTGGAIPVAKYFPGYGAAKKAEGADSQLVLDKDFRGLAEIMYPFNESVTRGIPGLVVGHVAVPVIDEIDKLRPASLSPILVKTILRERWGYAGVIIADDIGESALLGGRTPEQAAVQALAAGCDAVLFTESNQDHIVKVVEAVNKAVTDGLISKGQLDKSEERLDVWRDMLEKMHPSPSPSPQLVEPIIEAAASKTEPSASIEVVEQAPVVEKAVAAIEPAAPAPVEPEPIAAVEPVQIEQPAPSPQEVEPKPVETVQVEPVVVQTEAITAAVPEPAPVAVEETPASAQAPEEQAPRPAAPAVKEASVPAPVKEEPVEPTSPDSAPIEETPAAEPVAEKPVEPMPPESAVVEEKPTPEPVTEESVAPTPPEPAAVEEMPTTATVEEVPVPATATEEPVAPPTAAVEETPASATTSVTEEPLVPATPAPVVEPPSPPEPEKESDAPTSDDSSTQPEEAPTQPEESTETTEQPPAQTPEAAEDAPTESTPAPEPMPPAPQPDGTQKIVHRIQKGETLATIAKKYNVGQSDLAAWNGLDGDVIKFDNDLIVFLPGKPGEKTAADASAEPKPKPAEVEPPVEKYQVNSGDTLYGIADIFHTTVKEIMEFNSLTDPNIKAGQVLKIPAHEKKNEETIQTELPISQE